MRVPFSWLKEFAPVSASPRDVAEKLRAVGVPVARVEILGEGIRGVHSGKIVSLEAHPNADKLRVAKVNLGHDTLQIVTGAPNVVQGDMIPVAKIGARLAGGKQITEAKLRGLPSQGMMCSAAELALDLKEYLPLAQREGVMVLDPDTPLGIDLGPMLALEEAVFVLEPFANRPDFLSVFGVAREAAAAFGVPLKPPELDVPGKGSLQDKIKISIEDKAGCPRYIGRYASQVKVRHSPLGMAIRLSAAGVRPINNIVDITNYVLLELGQPLHAFDYAALIGKMLIVRRAHKNEKLAAIDGKTYELSEDMLVIADQKQPVALAGVMGGKETEISESSRDVLLESANFTSGLIRRTSLKLGLRSESSRRFEKGIDLQGADWGSRRACYLFRQAGFTVSEGVADVHDAIPPAPEISVSLSSVKKILGVEDLEREGVKKIVSGLGFGIRRDSPLVVEAPVFRGDIREEIDVAEEIARHYGYERIPTALPRGAVTAGAVNPEDAFDSLVHHVLSESGISEALTYSLGDPAYYSLFYSMPLALIRNPLTEDRKALRPLLYPEMLVCLKRNLHVKNRDLCFFEIGRVFEGTGKTEEKRHAAVVLTGKLPWGKDVSFYTLKGLLETVWRKLHMKLPLVLRGETELNFHPLRFVAFGPEKNRLGFLGEMHPHVLESLNIDQKVMVMEFDLDELRRLPREMKLAPVPLYPESRRDISMIVEERVAAGAIEETIRKSGKPLLEEVRIFDLYQGPQIPAGKKSIALSLIYRASDRTLTEEEVNAAHAKILNELRSVFNADLRM